VPESLKGQHRCSLLRWLIIPASVADQSNANQCKTVPLIVDYQRYQILEGPIFPTLSYRVHYGHPY